MQKTISALSVALLAPFASAQNPGFCGTVGASIDVQALTTTNNGNTLHQLFVGAARDKNGETWATCGNPTAGQPGKIVRFNAAGAYVAAYPQPAFATTGFAIRDLAYDGNNTIWGGLETATSTTIAAFDITTQTWDTNTGAGGKAWKAPVGPTVIRGLAYDPLGDNGNGSMYTSNFSATIYEFKRDGTIIRSFPATVFGTGAAPYGLAMDFVTRRLWAYSQGGSTHTQGVTQPFTGYNVVVGVDITQNPPVKYSVMGFADQAGGAATGYATPIGGGCEIATIGGRRCLVNLNQALSDAVSAVSIEFAYAAGCGGTTGMSGDGAWAGNPAWGISLDNSAASSAILILGVGEASIPLPPSLSNCAANIPVATWLLLPAQPVVGGTAVQPIPLPATISAAPVSFQWIEPTGTVIPVNFSSAAMAVVGHR